MGQWGNEVNEVNEVNEGSEGNAGVRNMYWTPLARTQLRCCWADDIKVFPFKSICYIFM